jgi:hypothetical protein
MGSSYTDMVGKPVGRHPGDDTISDNNSGIYTGWEVRQSQANIYRTGDRNKRVEYNSSRANSSGIFQR